ncbi:MAG: PAS domain S-box protein [Bacteroidia bacterium]
MIKDQTDIINNSESTENMLVEVSSDGFCVRANHATSALSGFKLDEIIGKKFKEFVELDENKTSEIENAISEGNGVVVNFEGYFKKKDGTRLFILWSAYWSVRNKSLICIGKDLSITEQRLVKANKELNLLNRINDLLRTGLEGNDLLDLVTSTLVEQGNYQLAWFGLFKENNSIKESLQVVSKSGNTQIINQLVLDYRSRHLDNDPFLEAIKIAIPIHEKYVNDYPNLSFNSLCLKKAGISNALFIPINFGNTGLGILNICSNDERIFDFHEIQILERIAENISLNLRFSDSQQLNSINKWKLSKINNELELLNQVNDIILREKDEHKLLHEAFNLVLSKSKYKLIWLTWYQQDHLQDLVIIPELVWGEKAYADALVLDFKDPNVLKGPTAQAILTGKPGIVNSTLSSPDYVLWRERAAKFGIKSSYATILQTGSTQRAAIGIYSGIENAFDDHEVEILQRIINNVGFAIHSIQESRINEQLRNSLESSNKLLRDYKFALDKSAIVSITNIDGDILSVNDNLLKISGYEKEDLIGSNHRLLNSGYHSKLFWKELWDTILSGKIWYGEIKNKKKDGSYFWLETTIIPINHDDGSITQFLAIRYDITDTKKLMEKNEYIRFLVDSTEDSIIGINENAIITSWNKGAEKIYGYLEEEANGKFIFDLLPSEYKNEETQFLQKLKNGESINNSFQLKRKRKDGSIVPLSITISSIEDENGNRIGVSEIARDISKELEAEEQLQKQIQFLKDISFINSFEIKQEISKLKSMSVFVAEKFKNSPDVEEVFVQAERSFSKLDSSLRKMSDLINLPLKRNTVTPPRTIKKAIKKICIIDGDLKHSAYLHNLLNPLFPPNSIERFTGFNEALEHAKITDADESCLVILDPKSESNKAWEYLKQHELLRLKTKIILFSEKVDEASIERAKDYKSVGNYLKKPFNPVDIQKLMSGELMEWIV